MTRWLWASTREAILERDASRCGYCGGEASAVDHILPVSCGGDDEPENLIAACNACNSIAHAKRFASLEEKRSYIGDRRLELSVVGIDGADANVGARCTCVACDPDRREEWMASVARGRAIHEARKVELGISP